MEIKNDCAKSPAGLLWHVRLSLNWIYPADLDGLGFVRLVDETPEYILQKYEDFRELEAEGRWIFGFYEPKEGRTQAHINLIIKRHYALMPSIYKFTPATTLLLAHTLAHEIGHHLIDTKGYVFEPGEKYKRQEFEEEFCNRYAFEVLRKMRRRWHYRLGMWGLKDLAGWQYIQGTLDWKEKMYDEAASHWHKAVQLNPDSLESLYWYHRATDMAGTKSQLTEKE